MLHALSAGVLPASQALQNSNSMPAPRLVHQIFLPLSLNYLAHRAGNRSKDWVWRFLRERVRKEQTQYHKSSAWQAATERNLGQTGYWVRIPDGSGAASSCQFRTRATGLR